MPVDVTLPSCASSVTVVNRSSMSSAGTTSTRARAVPSPALANLCTRPAGTTTDSPASATIVRMPEAELHRALEHVEALLLLRVHVRTGDVAVGGQLELELEQLAVGVGSGLEEGDALAADGVVDGLSGVSHDRS